MINHASIFITAWDADRLVGIARTLTDFSYVAYLADLAVRDSHQRLGISIELIRHTQQQLGDGARILLWAAPEAESYYPYLGFKSCSSAWLIGARGQLGSLAGSKS